jgi:hypothetical protein
MGLCLTHSELSIVADSKSNLHIEPQTIRLSCHSCTESIKYHEKNSPSVKTG